MGVVIMSADESQEKLGTTEPKYDAFISYSSNDGALASAIQTELQRLTKPWYRRRSLHVFRDQTNLAAGPKLWNPIEEALQESKYFVLVASPVAAESEWVNAESHWWLANRDIQTVVIAIVDGAIKWDSFTKNFNASETTCLPPGLLNAFPEEPHWIDFRSASAADSMARLAPLIASIFAAITGVDKDNVLGEDLRQYKRMRRTALSVIISIALLALLAVVVAVVAVRQGNLARSNATTATARALAAAAEVDLPHALDQGLLYAAAAYSVRPDSRSNSALLQALSDDPHLLRFTVASANVDTLRVIQPVYRSGGLRRLRLSL